MQIPSTVYKFWNCIDLAMNIKVLATLLMLGLMVGSVTAVTCKVGCNNSRKICLAGCKRGSFQEKRECSNRCETTFVICEKGCDRNKPTPWKN